jgi:D-alanyl-D-alanine carboxypeptidase
MIRPVLARLAFFAFFISLFSSCGGNPPPRAIPRGEAYRQPVSNAPGVSAPTPIPRTPPPPIVGESALVLDVQSGRVLYAKNADIPRAVASTQKIITALCVLDTGNIDKPVTISPSDASSIGTDATMSDAISTERLISPITHPRPV